MKKIVLSHTLGLGLIPLAVLLGTSSGLRAQKPTALRPFEITLNESEPDEWTPDGRISVRTGYPLALYDVNGPTQGTTAEARAAGWLSAQARRLGLRHADLSDLVLTHVSKGAAGTTLRFQQVQDGIPVYHGDIALTLNPAGNVSFVMNQYRPDLQVTAPAVLTETQARQAVHTYIGISGDLQFDQTRQMILHLNGTSRRVYQVRVVAASPIGDWEALIDAQDGTLLKVQDVSCYAHHLQGDPAPEGAAAPADYPACEAFLPPLPPPPTGTGFVFDADPLSRAGVAYAGAYVDGTDATNASLDAARSNVNLNNITLSAGTYSLVGPYARIMDFENPAKGLFTQASSTFSFNRNQDAFEAVNTYYHLDNSLSYINVTLGVACMPFQYAGGIQFDPSGLNGADNSHYVGSTGRIAFGEGGVDDAEDSDVILHELGHGLHDWLTNGNLSQVDGLSEGCGDYWAQSYSRSLGQWTSAQAAYHWVFNWDGHNPFWGGRTTNYGAAYPGGLVGQIHTDGQIWATCMMRIWDALGKTRTDRAFLEGLRLTNSTSSQRDAAIAVRQAAINMGYTSTEINTMSTILNGCGYNLPVILPVELSLFTGERADVTTNVLSWVTTREENNAGFVIERRLEGETEFTDAGFVPPHAVGAYSFRDATAGPARAWYRLRQMDTNGEAHPSQVVEISGIPATELHTVIAPHPVQGALQAHISFPAAGSHDLTVQITDLSGKVLLVRSLSCEGSYASVRMEETADLPAGSYLLHIHADGASQVSRFQVLH